MKLFYRSIIVITLAFFGFNQSVNASHISGGDISYSCIGQDSFLVTLNLFRDCNGIGAPTVGSMNFTSSCGTTVNASFALQNSFEISQLCPTQIPNSTCNGGAFPGMQQYTYSGIVVLPSTCLNTVWTLAWSSCCRNGLITNLTNPTGAGTYLYSTMYSNIDSCNSSPTFTSLPIPYVCLNQVVNYNFGVVEPDGDSIVYFLAQGWTSSTALVTFVPGFTILQPVAGGNAVLNTFNGQLTFTPTAVGVYVIVVRIEEYDVLTGLLKGESIRDVQIVVQNCSNLQPVIDSPGMFNFSSTGSGIQLDSNSLEVCIGDHFSFDVSFSDPNANQTINLFDNIYQALDSSALVTITPGNPATLHVEWTAQPGSASFISFTIAGVDNACPVPGLVSGVFNIHINPATYAGEDQSMCSGTQWIDLQATGGTNFTWIAISGSTVMDTVPTSPNFNMTCIHCDNPSVAPTVTTSYMVVSNLTGTCGNIDTVTITAYPSFNLFMPNDTIICPIDSIVLNASTDQPSFSYTYSWNHGALLNYDTIINPTALPSVPTAFTLTVEAAGGCTKTGTVFVDLSPPFPAGIFISGDTVICVGDSTMLSANLGDVSPQSCGLSLTPCMGPISTGIIGTGTQTNTGTSYPGPYSNFYWGAKHQILYTAAELHAMGMIDGGKINSISFDIATLGNVSIFNNFEVKIGCTSASDLSGGWETGLVTVLPGYPHSVNIGWNQHTFTNPYDWDGISNLVIEVCQNNSSWSSAGSSLSRYTTTTNQMVRYYRADNSTVCSSTNAGTASTNRPNIKFDYCVGTDPSGYNFSWAPNSNIDSTNIQSPYVYPTTTTSYTVIVQDTGGTCVDTITHQVTVVNQFDAGFSILNPVCINGGVTVAAPFIGGGTFAGTGIIDPLNGVFDPLTSGLGTYPVTYTVSSPTGGCLSDSTIDVTVIDIPDATFTPKEFCLGSNPDTLFAALPGGLWGGTGISDTTNGIFDPDGLPAGLYPISYTLTVPCYSLSVQNVRIIEPYSFVFVDTIVNVCEGSTIDLSSNYILSNNPLQGSGPIDAVWSDANGNIDTAGVFDATNLVPGDYIIVLAVSGTDGSCGSSQTMIVTVQPVDYPFSSGDLAYCTENKSAKIFINPWLFGTGVTFTQTPITPLGANDTLLITPYGQNGQFDASIQGIGQWEFEMTYVNLHGCVGVTTDTIYVLLTPEKPEPIPTTYCEGQDIILMSNASNPDSVYWFNDFNMTDTIGIGNGILWGTAPDPANGPYYVWATQNNWACVSGRDQFLLDVKESPVAAYEVTYLDTERVNQVNIPSTNSSIYGYTPFLVEFNAIGTVASDSVVWYHHYEIAAPNNAPNTSNNTNVSYNYITANVDAEGVLINLPFVNRLTVINEFGCRDTTEAMKIFSVASEQEFNVFTPNGDGLNDIFYLPIFGVNDLKIQIYNRWGKLVYEWEDATQGWDGEDQPDGVYFYVVTATNNDAVGSAYTKQGTVTLTGSGN